MKLYTHPVSPHCRKVHGVALHAGVDLEHEQVDLRAGEQRTPGFLALNPMGKVPVLVDGNTVLWESNAISIHLADRAGCPLWPRGKRRHDVTRWLFWESAHWIRPLGAILGQVIFRADDPDPAIIEQGRSDFYALARILDDHLSDQEFLSGDSASVAEYTVGIWLAYTDVCGLSLTDFPHLSDWNAKLSGLPGWSATLPPKP